MSSIQSSSPFSSSEIPATTIITNKIPRQNNNNEDVTQNNTLNKALNTNAVSQMNNGASYQSDDSNSKIQTGGGKSGWCYIGEDRGFRTCAEIGVHDNCMSGDIFPSHEICINPNLRA